MIPESKNKWAAQINIFFTPNYLESDKLMVLIQGSGAVRPGKLAQLGSARISILTAIRCLGKSTVY